MMTNEEVKREIINALCKLSIVDCSTKDKGQMTINSKRVHDVYNILDNLQKKL